MLASSFTGELEAPRYHLVSALFLRLLAIIYFIAFFSLSGQITGLVGAQGISPLSPWLDYLLQREGWSAYLFYPTVFWFNRSDFLLEAMTWAGCLIAVLLFFNVRARLMLLLLFIIYLSLVRAGQTFMNFQWDGLLLEAGFLAIFLRPDSRLMVFLFRWLLFRLRFMSGLSKLVMNDPSWLGMSALLFYFETQPIPLVGAWYFHNLPPVLLIMAAVMVLFIELVVPWMMFMRRRYRFFAAWLTLGLQLLILLSSNHNWFNLLTIVLCLFLFDDQALERVMPRPLQRFLKGDTSDHRVRSVSAPVRFGHGLLVSVFVVAGILNTWRMSLPDSLDYSVNQGLDLLQQWHIVNTYHVFPTMTTRQLEVRIEGSIDGREWREYEFRYRPRDPAQRPEVIIPHHPRLDWMMWFVTLHPRFLNWFDQFLTALLENAPAATSLLAANPFSEQAPNMLRVRLWQYRFTTPKERAASGNWWVREDLGLFKPLPGKYKKLNKSP